MADGATKNLLEAAGNHTNKNFYAKAAVTVGRPNKLMMTEL